MTIKSRFFSIALLAALAITASVSTLDAPSLVVSSGAVQAANAGAPATPILLAQYNPCTGGRCR
jgi:hypothetical protein